MDSLEGFKTATNDSPQFKKGKKQNQHVFFKQSKPAAFSRTFHSQLKDKRPIPLSYQGQDQYAKTATKVSQIYFDPLNPLQDVQDTCEYRKHVDKLLWTKPDLTKRTQYNNIYCKKQPIPNIINNDKEYQKLLGPHIGMDSGNRKDFTGRQGDKVERPHPEDLLKTGGPSPNRTSYNTGYPGHFGDNQYVKPQDKQTRGNFPLMSRTTYGKSFSCTKPTTKPAREGCVDQLKCSNLWLGQTSYGSNYKQTNPEDFAKKYKIIQKLQQNPNFKRQYETTYKNIYLGEKKFDPKSYHSLSTAKVA